MDEIDPEAAKRYREKQEESRVEERLRLRHSTKSKYARELKRFKGFEDEGVKEDFNNMLQEQ